MVVGGAEFLEFLLALLLRGVSHVFVHVGYAVCEGESLLARVPLPAYGVSVPYGFLYHAHHLVYADVHEAVSVVIVGHAEY